MKYIVASLFLIIGVAIAAPPQVRKPVPPPYKTSDLQSPKQATIIQQDYVQQSPVGNYNFGYQTSDGVQREEKAEVKNPGTDSEAIVVQGSYSYIGTDGVTYTVTYVADENGFRPTGQHIPTH